MNLAETKKILTIVTDYLINPQVNHYLHVDQVNNTTSFALRDMPYNLESVVTVTELPAPDTACGYKRLHKIQIGTTVYKIPKTRDGLIRFRKRLSRLKDYKTKTYPEFSKCVASIHIAGTIKQCMQDSELDNAYTLMKNHGIQPVFGKAVNSTPHLYMPIKKITIHGCEAVICWSAEGYNVMEPVSGLSISGSHTFFQSAKVAEYQTRERLKAIPGMNDSFFKQKIADNVCHDDLETLFCESVGVEVLG